MRSRPSPATRPLPDLTVSPDSTGGISPAASQFVNGRHRDAYGGYDSEDYCEDYFYEYDRRMEEERGSSGQG